MRIDHLVARLSANVGAIRALVEGVTDEQARWKPSPERWSILEVVNHLYDEEREDFRTRVDLLLHHPEKEWPGIDPQGWVTEREYARRELGPSLENFLGERERSLAWLAGLSSPKWDNSREHPVAGKMTAGDVMAAWVAHDFLHLRQLSRLHYQYVAFVSEPYSVRYAGDW